MAEMNTTAPVVSSNSEIVGSSSWRLFLFYHSAVIVCIVICTLLGNSLTIIALFRFRHLRRQKNALIGSLSGADLCIGLSVVIWLINVTLFGASQAWDVTDVLIVWSVFVSGCHMYAIGVDRFIAIVRPLHYRSWVTSRVIVAMIVTSWSVPTLVVGVLYIMALQRGGSTLDTIHGLTVIVSYILTVTVMSLVYGRILSETREQTRKIQAWASQSSAPGQPQQNTSNRGTKLMLIIITTTAILNLPYFIQVIVTLSGSGHNLYLYVFEYIAQECLLSNSSINFFIYAVFTSDFRRAYKSLLCCCRKKTEPDVTEADSVTNMSTVN